MKNHEQHRKHNHEVIDPEVFKIRNVPFTQTHDLVRCAEDKFFGWILKEES